MTGISQVTVRRGAGGDDYRLISVEGSDNPEYMNDLNTLLLMLGQRTVTEQTGNLFVKYLNKIEVLIDKPKKWDARRPTRRAA